MTIPEQAPDYRRQVFINCPYDEEYRPLMKAAIFGVHACGYRALFAAAKVGARQSRLEKILEMVRNCRLSIHDISRVEVERSGLPRFNMAFEFGIVYGACKLGGEVHRDKEFLLLDSKPNQNRKSLSDSAGLDPSYHGNAQSRLVDCVRHFLAQHAEAGQLVAGTGDILARYRSFARVAAKEAATKRRINATEIEAAEYLRDWQWLAAEWLEEAASD